MIKKQPLISIIVPVYKNYKYIYENLDSILAQDYSNIEIIVTDDASDDFDKKAVEKYLKTKSDKNIKNFIVHQNVKNLGTVKNLNNAIKLSKGDYITFLAADDVLYNKHVFSKYINCFNSLPKKELIVVAQVGMYDIKLKRLIQYFVSNENKEKINKLPPEKLFGEMSSKCILPGSSIFYKKELFKKYGYFDEKYKLVEDYSSALKFSRLGIKYNYFDFVSSKHRDGGISHGNKIGEVHKSKQYELDILNTFKNEVLPYINLLDKQQKRDFLKKLREQQWNYSYNFEFANSSKQQKIRFFKLNWKYGLLTFFSDFFTDLKDQLIGKKIKLFMVGIILMLNQMRIIKIIGLLLIAISFILLIIFLSKKYIPKLFNLIKFIF